MSFVRETCEEVHGRQTPELVRRPPGPGGEGSSTASRS